MLRPPRYYGPQRKLCYDTDLGRPQLTQGGDSRNLDVESTLLSIQNILLTSRFMIEIDLTYC